MHKQAKNTCTKSNTDSSLGLRLGAMLNLREWKLMIIIEIIGLCHVTY